MKNHSFVMLNQNNKRVVALAPTAAESPQAEQREAEDLQRKAGIASRKKTMCMQAGDRNACC